MKKILVIFSIFSLFILASCSNNDEEDFFPPEPDSDNGTNTTEPDSDNGTSDNEITDNDTTVINDDNSTEPDDNTDTTDNEITDNDTTIIDDNDSNDDDTIESDDNNDSGSDLTDNEITDEDTTVIDDNDTMESDDDSDTDSTDNEITDNDTTDIDDNESDNDDSTEPDNDADADSDTGSGEDEPHECAVNPTTPCKAGNLIWSSRSATTVDWDTAKSKCASYSEGKFTSGWKLPTINELRGIIQNCDKTKAGGDCQVTNECSSDSCYTNVSCKKVFGDICSPSVEHSPFGETEKLWSATDQSNDHNTAWYVYFHNAEIGYAATNNNYEIYYRRVHTVE